MKNGFWQTKRSGSSGSFYAELKNVNGSPEYINTGFKPTEPADQIVIGELTPDGFVIRGMNDREKEITEDVCQRLNQIQP